ncbi:MAG TPA: helix-turn-helix domain-containing protein [Ktedonobacterales bacterium]|nr:helix-turn-helix domain-containing protein [Ktedonobacterales bacterium]
MELASQMTAAQVAALLDVHTVTVWRWLRSGQLRGRKLSRKSGWRVRHSDLADFLQERAPIAPVAPAAH